MTDSGHGGGDGGGVGGGVGGGNSDGCVVFVDVCDSAGGDGGSGVSHGGGVAGGGAKSLFLWYLHHLTKSTYMPTPNLTLACLANQLLQSNPIIAANAKVRVN